MKVSVPITSKGAGPAEVDQAEARRHAALEDESGVLPPAGLPDLASRHLPVVYIPLLAMLVAVAAIYGLVVVDAYRLVPPLTRETWRAQDAVTLATVPVLLWTTWRARAGSLSAHLASVGILTWMTYGYAHLSIGAPFNAMFLVYVAALTLAGFAMLDGLLRVDVAATSLAFAHLPRRATAWFLAISGTGIALLWLSEIVVALPGGLPANIHLAELPNPTWVLDLGWIIPSSLAAALMLRRRHPAGPVLAGAVLVMLLILSVTMLVVVPFALAAGLGADPVVRQQLVVFTVLFSVLGAVELWLLARARRRLGVVTSSWLRRGWWPRTPEPAPCLHPDGTVSMDGAALLRDPPASEEKSRDIRRD
jgi:hypothetical protein